MSYSVFYGEYENDNKKGQKNLTFPNGDLNPGFLNKFPPKIWILREIELIELVVLKISRLYVSKNFVLYLFQSDIPRRSLIRWRVRWRQKYELPQNCKLFRTLCHILKTVNKKLGMAVSTDYRHMMAKFLILCGPN